MLHSFPPSPFCHTALPGILGLHAIFTVVLKKPHLLTDLKQPNKTKLKKKKKQQPPTKNKNKLTTQQTHKQTKT